MIAPGATYTAAGRLNATAGAASAPTLFVGGVGYLNTQFVAIETNAVAGVFSDQGIAQSSAGAFYGTTTASGTDFFQGGLRISATGQIVYVQANPASVVNGNPLAANGALCIA